MGRPPIPIGQINRRIPEAGRIRTGEQVRTGSGKMRPAAIADFIFTSAERNNVEAVARLYEGEVVPFKADKSPDRWMVRPGITEVAVALPPDPLGGTPIYEQYGGGGATHRCDGILCTKYRKVDGAPEPYEVDCECAAAGVLVCNVTTHLSVLLQGVRMTGVWRLTTKSYNAAVELPGMVDMVQSLQTRGIVRAVLGLKPHRQVLAGVTREFLVPVLGVDATLEELAAGQASVAALPAAPVATETPVAIGSGGGDGEGSTGNGSGEDRVLPTSTAPAAGGTSGSRSSSPVAPSGAPDDDDIVDAEIVEDGGGEAVGHQQHAGGEPTGDPPPTPSVPGSTDLTDLAALMKERGVGKAAVRRIYNEHAERLGEEPAAKFDAIAPGPVLDAAYEEIDRGPNDDGPDGSGAAGVGAGGPSDGEAPPAPSEGEPGSPKHETAQKALHAKISNKDDGYARGRDKVAQDQLRHALVKWATDGRTESSSEATAAELVACRVLLVDSERGRGDHEVHLTASGTYVVRQRRSVAA